MDPGHGVGIWFHGHVFSGKTDAFAPTRDLLINNLKACAISKHFTSLYTSHLLPPPLSLIAVPSRSSQLFHLILGFLPLSTPPPILAVNTGARAPRGGVTRQGVVLTDLQSLCDCQ
jgi:hypothetical protein